MRNFTDPLALHCTSKPTLTERILRLTAKKHAKNRLHPTAGSVVDVAATCEWCKKQFTDLHVVGSKPEPHPMCDECLAFAEEEFRPQNVKRTHGARKEGP